MTSTFAEEMYQEVLAEWEERESVRHVRGAPHHREDCPICRAELV